SRAGEYGAEGDQAEGRQGEHAEHPAPHLVRGERLQEGLVEGAEDHAEGAADEEQEDGELEATAGGEEDEGDAVGDQAGELEEAPPADTAEGGDQQGPDEGPGAVRAHQHTEPG